MHGIIAAVPTPFNQNGTPVNETFISHCEWVLDNGCDGINILGSTGEANSLSILQRKSLMENAASHINLKKLMVGTGTPSLNETIDLTETADSLGYQVALVLPPYYYKPVTNLGLYKWYESLHKCLGSRKIEIYFYNFPQMTGLTIPTDVIKELNLAYPERFCGIKDSSGEMAYCRQLAKIEGFKVFPSSEISISEAHKSNFSGCISATANETSALCAAAWASKKKCDPSLIDRIRKIRMKIASESLVSSIKFLLAKRTKNATWHNVLPPLSDIGDRRGKDLIKFFEFIDI